MSYSKITLYVKSVRTVTGVYDVRPVTSVDDVMQRAQGIDRGVSSPFRGRTPYAVRKPRREYVLPEDQQKTVEAVERIARAYGLEVEVLDVARENVLRRMLQEERERIKTFPTLAASSEQRLEGEIAEEQVKFLFSKIAERTRKKYV